jgi:transposase
VLRRALGVTGCEGVSAAANVFVGMVEAPLFTRPNLARRTRGELFCVMTCGMATIAGTEMILYARSILTGPRRHLSSWSRIGTAFWSATVMTCTEMGQSPDTCRAHLIRKAEALAEGKKADYRRFGRILAGWLRQLIHFAKEPPDPKQWSDFYRFFLLTVSLWEADNTDAGKLARQIRREVDNLWVFLDHEGLDPTNNCPERALRFGVLWRKRSLGTQSEKGNRGVERILSFRETCRLKTKATFPVLADCVKSHFQRSSYPVTAYLDKVL